MVHHCKDCGMYHPEGGQCPPEMLTRDIAYVAATLSGAEQALKEHRRDPDSCPTIVEVAEAVLVREVNRLRKELLELLTKAGEEQVSQ